MNIESDFPVEQMSYNQVEQIASLLPLHVDVSQHMVTELKWALFA